MRRRTVSLLLGLVALTFAVAVPSVAGFGFELSEWSGRPGDRVDVRGSGLLTCCPSNTPTEAALITHTDPERPSSEVVIFDGVVADASGNFSTTFTVPPLPAGTYELRYCSIAPESLTAGGGMRVCVPAQRSFTISEPVSYLWPVLAGVLLIVILILTLWYQRRRKRRDVEAIGSTGTAGELTDPSDQIETLSGRPLVSGRPR